MRRLFAFGVLGVSAGLAGCAPLPADPQPPTPVLMSLPDRVLVKSGGRVVSVALEDYVATSILSEVSPTGESFDVTNRIFDVQAIVARSYAVFELGRHRSEGFDLCDSTHCQLYEPARLRTSVFAGAARAAAQRTAGWVLSYRGRVAEALFHADCGGYTAGADAVWGGQRVPYLLAEPDEIASAAHKPWQLSVPLERLRLILNSDARTQVGRRLTGVDVRTRDVSGRASEIVMAGEFSPGVRGEDLRTVINATLGASALKSTRFTVTRAGTDVVFAGTGYGHGVGLCQIGAAARARRGEQPRDILAHYFPSAGLVRAAGTH